MAGRRPRILVTGFSSFPGMPANPTEALIEALAPRTEELAGFGDVRLAVLPTEYRAVPGRLEALGRDFDPDIALHFGVSARATGFAVETLARNVVCKVKPDASGHVPAIGFVREGGQGLASSLPAEAILTAIRGRGLPADFSDDAGDYLCNFLFYLSRGAHHPPFAPAQAGFVHVPPFGAVLGDGSARMFGLEMLVESALAAIAVCAESWDDLAGESFAMVPLGEF